MTREIWLLADPPLGTDRRGEPRDAASGDTRASTKTSTRYATGHSKASVPSPQNNMRAAKPSATQTCSTITTRNSQAILGLVPDRCRFLGCATRRLTVTRSQSLPESFSMETV